MSKIKITSLSKPLQHRIKQETAIFDETIPELIRKVKDNGMAQNVFLADVDQQIVQYKHNLLRIANALKELEHSDKLLPDAAEPISSVELIRLLVDDLDDVVTHAKNLKNLLINLK